MDPELRGGRGANASEPGLTGTLGTSSRDVYYVCPYNILNPTFVDSKGHDVHFLEKALLARA
jgi:hypothetical protein